MNKKYVVNLDSNENQFVPEFEPIDEVDKTFMGRLLTAVLKQLDSGFYLDQQSTWYNLDGE